MNEACSFNQGKISRILGNSSQFNANRHRRVLAREVPFVIKPAVIKSTNIKIYFITARFSNFPVLCALPLRLPWSLPVSNCNRQHFYGTYSLIQLFDSYNEITSEVINKILVNQKVFITHEELDRLKGIPGVKFDLPSSAHFIIKPMSRFNNKILNDETTRAFIALVGRQRSQKSGVYIFTHKESGSKYVGSSNNLFFRLFDYFRYDAKSDYTGLLLPMLRKQGLGAFSLEIFIIPAEFSPNSYLYLEQYHLLNKKFDLNTQ